MAADGYRFHLQPDGRIRSEIPSLHEVVEGRLDGRPMPAGMNADILARLVLVIAWGMAVEAQSGVSRRGLRRTIALALSAWPNAKHSNG
jgi:hypothetical protein